jgi:flagellar hook-associated protein 1 FlgK
MRQQVSGVNLNQQAATLMQLQQAYEASAKVVSVIDTLTQATLGLLTPSSVV